MRAADLVQGVKEIASLPSIYERLNQVVVNPRASARDIGLVVSEDPGLTARLLKLVNSAFFGFPSKIETVSRALMIVGTEQLKELALATSVVEMFEEVPVGIVDMESFWKHSLACGVFARCLAAQCNESNVERYFVAGLLHDVGLIVFYLKAPEEAKKVLVRVTKTRQPLDNVERDMFGFDHAEIGELLLKEWNLPSSLQVAVGGHHNPDQVRQYLDEAAIVHIADILAHSLKWGGNGEQRIPHVSLSAWERLKLPESILPKVIEEAEKQYQEAVKIILKQ